jgi:hypothetical protein
VLGGGGERRPKHRVKTGWLYEYVYCPKGVASMLESLLVWVLQMACVYCICSPKFQPVLIQPNWSQWTQKKILKNYALELFGNGYLRLFVPLALNLSATVMRNTSDDQLFYFFLIMIFNNSLFFMSMLNLI